MLVQRGAVWRHPDVYVEANVPGKGRGVLSKRTILPGQLIATADPTAYTLDEPEVAHRCYWCLKSAASDNDQATMDLKSCTGCRYAKFCGKTCQRAAWPSHKLECRSIAKVAPSRPSPLMLLLARIVRGKNAGTIPTQAIDLLLHHRENMSDSTKEKFANILMLMKTQFLLDGEECDMNDTMTILCKISANSFSLCNAELQNIGTSLYTDLAAFNHSCYPNCAAIHNGKTLAIRTIRKVQPGDELTISYIDVRLPFKKRRTQLLDVFHFQCDCERCRLWDTEKRGNLTNSPFRETMWKREQLSSAIQCPKLGCANPMLPMIGDAQLYKCSRIDCGYVVNASGQLDGLELELRQIDSSDEGLDIRTNLKYQEDTLKLRSKVLAKTHSDRIDNLEKLADIHVNLGNFGKACEIVGEALKATQATCARETPALAIELIRVGKLSHYLGNLPEATNAFGAALNILQNSHGHNHPLVSDTEMRLAQATGELNQQR